MKTVKPKVCKCVDLDPYWKLATNEDGWTCCRCQGKLIGEPDGFRPDLDRARIGEKVQSILLLMHDGGFIHVSNGGEGESIVEAVAEYCERRERFDQYTIIDKCVELVTRNHAAYWQKISRDVLSGKDKRERCWCGKLATSFVVGKPDGSRCTEHYGTERE